MALDALETFVAVTGNLYLAEVGSTLPAPGSDPATPPDAAFLDCGYSEEDGVSLKVTPDIKEFGAWQATTAVRRSRKSQVLAISGKFEQHNPVTIPAAFGGGSFDTTDFPTYTFPVAGDPLVEYAVILDVLDGDRIERHVLPRANAGLDEVEVSYNADNLASLVISLKSLAADVAPYVIYSDDAAFAPAS